MFVFLPILLAAGTLVPDYFAYQRAYQKGAISGPEYAVGLADAIAHPDELSLARRTEQVGRGICLTTLVLEAMEASRNDRGAQDELARLFFRPPKQARFVSPDGFFTIHYDTTGTHAVYGPTVDVNPADGVPDYVNRCAEFFDLSWRVEVDTLGFDPPGSDNGLGGSDNYDVYLHHYSGAYGVTFPEGPATEYPGRRAYYSHIFVDPSYSGFGYSDRTEPLKVTAAHEFQHACQFSYDTFEDSAWMEHCATWMEDVVFDDVNDYVNYLPYFMSLPHKPLYWFNELYPYGACVWAHFLDQKYGREVIRLTWEQCITVTAQQGVDNVLREIGSSRDEAVAEFRVWNYFTGSRDDGLHYEEGAAWPLVPFMADHGAVPVTDGAPGGDQTPSSLACNYVRFHNLGDLDSLRVRFEGQTNRTWVTSIIVPGADTSAQEVGAIPLTDGQGTHIVHLADAEAVIMIPTCVSLASGTYGYWARDGYELMTLDSLLIVDDGGDGDSRIEAGERFGLGVSFTSIAAEWAQAVLTVTTADPDLTILQGQALLGSVTIGDGLVCPAEHIQIQVAPSAQNHMAPLQLGIGPEGAESAQLFDITLQIGTPPLLVFDDDAGQDREAYVAATLDSLGMLYDVWDDGLDLFPAYPLAELDFDPYDAVLWLTGDVGNTLDEADVARVHAILDGGGHLLLSGQDVAESLGAFSEGQALLAEVGIAWDGRENLSGIFGVEADPVFDGLKFATSGYGFDGANNQTSRDRLQVTGDAEVCLTYQTGHPAAVRREWGDARVLFVGFGVEAVVDNNPSVNTRREFLAAALDYLVNGITGADGPSPTVLRITGLWPNPTTGEIRAALAASSPRSGLRVVLLDLAGRQVGELFDTKGLVPPLLSLRLPDGMPSGAYLVRFETQGSRTTLPVTVIR